MYDNNQAAGITLLNYAPATFSSLHLEIFRMSDLRARVPLSQLCGSRRYDFHLMLLVTHGTVRQSIDSSSFTCNPGTFVCIRPGQVHHLESKSDWDGWLILFKPDMLLPEKTGAYGHINSELAQLNVLSLTENTLASTEVCIMQMLADIQNISSHATLNPLTYHQLSALIIRLRLQSEMQNRSSADSSRDRQRFLQFTSLIEEKFTVWHHVSLYAGALNCSARSLTRATSIFSGCSAKTFLSDRITLEARRLLTHTSATVGLISEILGFNEPTHFVKFFKKNTGIPPARFRNAIRADELPAPPSEDKMGN